jgi:hypothetical protein
MQKIASDLAMALIDAAEKIVTGLIQFIEDLITLMQKGLNTPIEIPFFSAFYKSIAGNDLTILDAVMLVLAVPTTIIYKIATNQAPALDPNTLIFPDTGNVTPVVNRTVRLTAVEGAEGEKEELTPGQRAYQHWGGFWGLLAQAVGDGLGVLQAYKMGEAQTADNIDEATELREAAEKIGKFVTAIDLAKLPGIFPLGYDPEVPWQRTIWGIELASPIIEFGLDRCLPAATKNRAAGLLLVIHGAVVGVLECVVFGYEMANPHNDDKGWDIVKLIQNVFYTVGKISNGVLYWAPGNAYAMVGALSGAGLGGVVNGIRLLYAGLSDLEYQRY